MNDIVIVCFSIALICQSIQLCLISKQISRLNRHDND